MALENYEYIVNGKVVKLPVNPGKIAVRFDDSLSEVGRRSVIDPKSEVGTFDERYEVPNEKLTIVDVALASKPAAMRVADAASALSADPNVTQTSPVFDLGDKQAVASDRIIVGFKPDTADKAAEIIRDGGGEILEDKWNEYVVRLKPGVSPFDAASELLKRAEVDFAEPDFITIGQHTPRQSSRSGGNLELPNGDQTGDSSRNPILTAPDESELPVRSAAARFLAPEQTAVQTGTVGAATTPAAAAPDPFERFKYAARITRAIEARELAAPSAEIKIAILDEGVDVRHPDLSPLIRGTFDAKDNDADQQPNDWDGHGTACAGLAAASPHGARGFKGIAAGCSLLGVRIAYSQVPRGDWITTNSMISRAIDWSWQNGADILSNSWGGGAQSNAVISAFERARTMGRSGKGCVIIIAAGNDAGPVSFPATLPNVLTVSASNEFDEPKTMTSADGEAWWGSNFGPEVDVAAPGVHNYTTDISDAAGYNRGDDGLDGDYTNDFNGTSSATPITAGVAALVLSANPALREASVRRIIKQTADKVGRVVYTNSRNDQMGYGRVNAVNAVNAARTAI